MKAREEYLHWNELKSWLCNLKVAANNSDVLKIRTMFKNLMPEYIPEKKVADWIYNEQQNNDKSDRIKTPSSTPSR